MWMAGDVVVVLLAALMTALLSWHGVEGCPLDTVESMQNNRYDTVSAQHLRRVEDPQEKTLLGWDSEAGKRHSDDDEANGVEYVHEHEHHHHHQDHETKDGTVDTTRRLQSLFASSSSTAILAAATPLNECGTPDPSDRDRRADRAVYEAWRHARTSFASQSGGNGSNSEGTAALIDIDYTIPVYVHVVQTSINDELISDARVDQYMDYLNDAYGHTDNPFFFDYQATTRTVNSEWSNDCRNSTIQTAMKGSLRVGGKETLNIWICNLIPLPQNLGFLAGFAYYPFASNVLLDGVVLARSDSNNDNHNNRVNTLVHEVGHFLGLFHTFTGGCNVGASDGDSVDDTPAHISDPSVVHCRKSGFPDTCPTVAGFDPVDNYLTVSLYPHECRTRFTPGQVERMVGQFELYRYLPPPTDVPSLSPSDVPSASPSDIPSVSPAPTGSPAPSISEWPSEVPSLTMQPSAATDAPITVQPIVPTGAPVSAQPTDAPVTLEPTAQCRGRWERCDSKGDCCGERACRSLLGLDRVLSQRCLWERGSLFDGLLDGLF